MSTLETSSSQQGMKGYICRHTCGCKLRHSTEFTRTSVSSQGALWYHEHNDTLHPKHTHECEYERYKNTRKIKDGKDKKDIKPDKVYTFFFLQYIYSFWKRNKSLKFK